ncbi:hypothetical protein ACH5RR_023308 [Cinchona calisaya]|uniref:Uncharacterized protein n=1 Tax=Cinchona calisaya TaxID=153742 RepID=A0ABD2ZAA0_9GENT
MSLKLEYLIAYIDLIVSTDIDGAAHERIAELEAREIQMQEKIERKTSLHIFEFLSRACWKLWFRRLRDSQRDRLLSIREALRETFDRTIVDDEVTENKDNGDDDGTIGGVAIMRQSPFAQGTQEDVDPEEDPKKESMEEEPQHD